MSLSVTEQASTASPLPAPVPLTPAAAGSLRQRAPVPGPAAAVLRTARPRQWAKNLLVFAAPAAAGALLHRPTAVAAALAFVAFTLAASATYFFNDAADAAADRLHPTKSRRPVAAGLISPRAARLIGLLTAAAALAVAATLTWPFAAVVGCYLVLTAAYSARLKKLPVVDVLAVAAGFLLRAAGGGLATGVALSNWFLLVALFGSLFLITAKRSAEYARIQGGTGGAVQVRPALAGYTSQWLHQILTMSLTGTVMAYSLWAFQYVGHDVALPLLALSLVPFLAALMRYSLLVTRGSGETPEEVLASDRFLALAGLSWALLTGAGLYLA
jgi:decaprenyl-phosphate phosphoribosyltransferase